jgi:hypothetical protein
MAKNAFPGTKSSGGLLKKVVGTVVVLALLTLVVKHPSDAATWTKALFGLAGEVIDGIVTFFQQVGN